MSTRDKSIVDRRTQGLSLQEIANEFDMTRERVRQILVKLAPELTAKEVRRIQNDRAEQDLLSRRKEIADLFQARWPEFESMRLLALLDTAKAELLEINPYAKLNN